MNKKERAGIDYALAHLRMAYDLRNAGDVLARDYERLARRALVEVSGVQFDLLREEGTQRGEPSASLQVRDFTVKGGAA